MKDPYMLAFIDASAAAVQFRGIAISAKEVAFFALYSASMLIHGIDVNWRSDYQTWFIRFFRAQRGQS